MLSIMRRIGLTTSALALIIGLAPLPSATAAPSWTLIYQTTNSDRNASDIFEYSASYGKSGTAATNFINSGQNWDLIRIRIEATASGNLYYTDAYFDKWSGATISGLELPDHANLNIIQRNVSNLVVSSNYSGVKTGSYALGRLEIWPYNYAQRVSGLSPAGNASLYDWDDTYLVGTNGHGSFQLHNLTDTQTVFAWNRHRLADPAEIGMGAPTSGHPDWTFNTSVFNNSNFKVQIYVGSTDSTVPSFTNSASFSVSENITTSANAATIQVSESSTITISAGVDAARFAIVYGDSTTAYIRFVASPNFEAPDDVGLDNIYNITVRAVDPSTNAATQAIIITITNVNEAPVITNNSSGATYSISQAENISSVVTYAATDVDASTTLSWSIAGTDAGDFTIGSSSGVLAFAVSPDYEAPADSDSNNIYIVIVTISDGSLTDTQTLTLTITNANESSTIGAATISGAIYKGINITITVSLDVAGKVRFLVGGKRIAGCLAKTTSGSYPNYSATCSWKPTVMGRQSVSARITPTDNTFSAVTSVASAYWVLKRATTR
jgi:hypothetical protein